VPPPYECPAGARDTADARILPRQSPNAKDVSRPVDRTAPATRTQQTIRPVRILLRRLAAAGTGGAASTVTQEGAADLVYHAYPVDVHVCGTEARGARQSVLSEEPRRVTGWRMGVRNRWVAHAIPDPHARVGRINDLRNRVHKYSHSPEWLDVRCLAKCYITQQDRWLRRKPACRRGSAQAGTLVTSGALIDVLAQHQPGDTAVETGEQRTSYKQLLDLARAIREQITRSPVGPGPVVVADDPGAGACATIAATQALGRAYVPLSASHPAARIQQILAAAEPALIVQSDRTATRLADVLPDRYPLLTISRQMGNLSWARSPGPTAGRASPIGSGIAYVMFTSGTTGRPKGVPVRAESLTAYLDVATKRFGVRPGDRASHFFELTFDLSVHDIFVTLLGGGTLVVIPAEQRMLPARFLREKEISHWFSVPSAADSLHRVGALRPGVFPRLRQTLFCGEPLRWPVAEAWQTAAPNSTVINLYGPTEATIAISFFVLPPHRPRSNDIYGIVPIGQVFEGQRGEIFISPETGEQPNSRGELWLSGSQVISGYLDPGDGRNAFASDPDGVSWYRTGDAVERGADGLLHFVGRIDHQLKVSGYRVEPAEIEDTIHRSFPGCRSVVILCDRGKRRGLVAAIVSGEGNTPTASAIRDACATGLPSYMVPAHVVELDSWPVNANGKIDRAAVRRQVEDEIAPGMVAQQGAKS